MIPALTPPAWVTTDNPEELIARSWDELTSGVEDSHHPFHTATLATVDDMGRAAARTVVLRQVDQEKRRITFNADWRSEKVAQMRVRPEGVGLLLYSPPLRLQLRMMTRVTLHHLDRVAEETYLACQPMSRLCYMTPYAPGAIVPFPPTQPGKPQNPREGIENFTVVSLEVISFESLALHSSGHRRARRLYSDPPSAAIWLAP